MLFFAGRGVFYSGHDEKAREVAVMHEEKRGHFQNFFFTFFKAFVSSLALDFVATCIGFSRRWAVKELGEQGKI